MCIRDRYDGDVDIRSMRRLGILVCMSSVEQNFRMHVGGHRHHIEIRDHGWRRTTTWWVDEQQVAARTSSDESMTLTPEEGSPFAPTAGAVRVRCTILGSPVRATWFEGEPGAAEAAATVGRGGIDLTPDEGSPAARREQRTRDQPRLHAARHAVLGVGKVVAPIVGLSLIHISEPT